MGPKQVEQAAPFCEISLEDHVPHDRLLRSIDHFVDLSSIGAHLADFYNLIDRPSFDPELLTRRQALELRMDRYFLRSQNVFLVRMGGKQKFAAQANITA